MRRAAHAGAPARGRRRPSRCARCWSAATTARGSPRDGDRPDHARRRRASPRHGARLGAGVVVALGTSACPVRELAARRAWLADAERGPVRPVLHGLPAIADAARRVMAGGTRRARRAASCCDRWGGQLPGRGACRLPDGAVALPAQRHERLRRTSSPTTSASARAARCRRPPVLATPTPARSGRRMSPHLRSTRSPAPDTGSAPSCFPSGSPSTTGATRSSTTGRSPTSCSSTPAAPSTRARSSRSRSGTTHSATRGSRSSKRGRRAVERPQAAVVRLGQRAREVQADAGAAGRARRPARRSGRDPPPGRRGRRRPR